MYRDAQIIVLDEATSALDTFTEDNVMEQIAILRDHITILLITHRIDTLKNCSQIIEIEGGRVTRIGEYNEFFRNRV